MRGERRGSVDPFLFFPFFSFFFSLYFILFLFSFLDTPSALMALVALTTSHSSDCAFPFFLLLFRRRRKNNQIIVVTAQAAQPSLIARSIENERRFRLLKRPLPQRIKRKSVRRKSASINSESSSYRGHDHSFSFALCEQANEARGKFAQCVSRTGSVRSFALLFGPAPACWSRRYMKRRIRAIRMNQRANKQR